MKIGGPPKDYTLTIPVPLPSPCDDCKCLFWLERLMVENCTGYCRCWECWSQFIKEHPDQVECAPAWKRR